MPRDTRTGGVLEAAILPSLTRGGYTYQQGIHIGSRFGGGQHKLDVLAIKENKQFLLSLKWQQTSGTAEQKIPFEICCLIDAIRNSNLRFTCSYLILGGHGWKLKNFYINVGLREYLNYEPYVTILDLEAFITKANRSQL